MSYQVVYSLLRHFVYLEMQQDITSQVQGLGRMMNVICIRSLEALAEARLGVVPGLCLGRW